MKQSFTLKKEEKETEYYTTKKYNESIDSDGFYRLSHDGDNVFAKATKSLKSKNSLSNKLFYRYYIKCHTNKTPFDPFDNYSLKEAKVSYIDNLCKGSEQFLEVNQSVFNKYINFLKTENKNLFVEIGRDIK
jgi:hypothetical protein